MHDFAGIVMWDRCKPLRFAANASHRDGVTLALDGCFYDWPLWATGATDADRLLAMQQRLDERLAVVEGDFAIVAWDERTRRLHLARDRFGVRPLYYATTRHGAVFASSLHTVLMLTDLPIEPRPEYVARYAVSHYRTFDNDDELSPILGVKQVPAGCVVSLDEHGIATKRYWSLEELEGQQHDEGAMAERLRELLHHAVRRRIERSTTPMFTLSGGMDSSSVVFIAAKLMQHQVKAVSAIYEHAEYDESYEVREALAGTDIEWLPIEVSNALNVNLLVHAIAAHGEPLATATWLAHYQLCGAVGMEGATDLFDGLGGDELNAGEYEYFPYFFADLRASGDETRMRHEIACWATLHNHPIHRKGLDVAQVMMKNLTDPCSPGRCLPDRRRWMRYADVLADGESLLRGFEPRQEHPFTTCLQNRAFQDLTRETMPCCLRASHRNTAAHGMINRSPFLDRALVEFMFSVPGTMKIRDGVTKYLLRQAMRGVLPESTRSRTKKVGWNAPSDRWFVGEGAAMMRDLVSSRQFRERCIYKPARLLELIDEHEQIMTSGEARENHMMLLWQALNIELWHRMLENWRAARRLALRPGFDDLATQGHALQMHARR